MDINIDFDDILKQVINDQNKIKNNKREKKQRKNSDVYPSSLGICMRKQILDGARLNSDIIDDDLQVIFYHGNVIHDDVVYPILKYYFTKLFESNDPTIYSNVENEVPFKKEVITFNKHKLHFKGYIDDVITISAKTYSGMGGKTYDPDDPMYVVHHSPIGVFPIEVKSIGNAFYKLKEPKMAHQVQLMCYLGLHNYKYGYILYVHKETLKSKIYKLEFNQAIWDKLVDRAEQIYLFKQKGVIPYAEAMVEAEKGDYWFKKDNQCEWCPYNEFCKTNKGELNDNNSE